MPDALEPKANCWPFGTKASYLKWEEPWKPQWWFNESIFLNSADLFIWQIYLSAWCVLCIALSVGDTMVNGAYILMLMNWEGLQVYHHNDSQSIRYLYFSWVNFTWGQQQQKNAISSWPFRMHSPNFSCLEEKWGVMAW